MPIYLGLDAGGTQTRALAIDREGEVVHAGMGGPANLATGTDDGVHNSISEAVRGCPRPDFVVGCFAGIVSEAGRQRALQLLRKWLPNAQIDARPDFHATLAASPDGATCSVIAGTGSVVASFVRGEVVKSGGGGPLLGDQGSAFAVGRRMLQVLLAGAPASAHVADGLTREIGSKNLGEAIAFIYSAPHPASLVARIAPCVAEDALEGDPNAEWAINHEMGLLAELTINHLLRFHADVEQPRVILSGGLWEASKVFQKEFENAMKAATGMLSGSESGEAGVKRYIIDRLQEPPVAGAVKLARRLDDEHRIS